jgi:urease accessory protein
MQPSLPIDSATTEAPAGEWRARLSLRYERRDQRTVLAQREHVGPLVVQRPFYPEGPEVCHTILVHPPGGIAGGDRLEVRIEIGPGAHTLLTTPGATKWYRSNGRASNQDIWLTVAQNACLEWLPQETIVFSGAHARASLSIELGTGGLFLGWDVVCFGRSASGERFDRGLVRQLTRIGQGGRLLWTEQMRLEGGSRLLDSAAGLRGCPVNAVLLAAGREPAVDLVEACRKMDIEAGAISGVTVLPSLLVVRYLGHSTEGAHSYLRGIWGLLRTGLVGREACAPRIWST